MREEIKVNVASIIYRIFNRLERYLNKKELERRVGKKLPKVTVLGRIYFQGAKIDCGDNVVLYPGVTFSGSGLIKLGNNCKIGQNVIIYAGKNSEVSVGENTIIAGQTYIIDTNHQMYKGELISNQKLESSPIRIGNDIWIGANCSIIKGAQIGNGAVIGAKALVNSVIEENGIAVGVPAKVVKYRVNR